MPLVSRSYVIVPYREREVNLKIFTDYMEKYFAKDYNVYILIVEQGNMLLFNRGILANIGIVEAKKLGASSEDCIIIHDVDLLPFPGIDYHRCDKVYSLSHRVQSNKWKPLYSTYLGGVTSMSVGDWEKCNGFDNNFSGYGGEDDDLYRRCKLSGVIKGKISTHHLQEETRYFNIHTKQDKREVKDPKTIDRWFKELKNDKSNKYKYDGLNTVKYNVLKTKKVSTKIIHVIVNF